MPHVLVTGGLGFIGSNFIKHLLGVSKSWYVTNVDAESYGSNHKNLSEFEDSECYRFLRADVSDRKAVENLVSQVELIINFAAETHVDRSISDPDIFARSNTMGTLTLLQAARKNHVEKFIQISTDEVYGSTAEGSSHKETDSLEATSPYAASKAAADLFVQAFHKTYGLRTVILRCTNNFGMYQFPEKFIPKTVIGALTGRRIPIYGNGMQVRDWIYVVDFCNAISLAIEKGEAGATYNVSAGNELPNIDVAKMILQMAGRSSHLIQFVEDRPGHDFRYSLDSTKIRNELSWKPSHTFPDALKETINWYVNSEEWWKPLVSEKVLSPTPWKESW